MRTLHLVSHTHWDREWYLTFQQFRLKLVHMMDSLLALLETNPEFKHFMLDGQTILLEDYLEIRPERAGQIRALVQAGRLLIGPWYVLPDEFLVSPEALIRNLLEGERIAQSYGGKMQVGYIPDPFGHIGQMPQILLGFGIDTACLQRGLSDEPLEFWWQAPDGSRVFMAYLRQAYGNAVGLPAAQPEIFAAEVRRRRDRLLAHSPFAQHLLLMQGNDHWLADPNTPSAISYTNNSPGLLDGDHLVHSTLPKYISAARAASQDLLTIPGELRSSRRHNLLPGVLSARMWIKQRNHTCQILLEKWAEPFSTFAELVAANPSLESPPPTSCERVADPAPILRQAWRYLMACHPHDSICGCSIDQVHEEMKPRFDQVQQIGEEITRQSLHNLARATCTIHPTAADGHEILAAAVVFNPTDGPRSDAVEIELELPHDLAGFKIINETGTIVPHQVLDSEFHELLNLRLDREALQDLFRQIQTGRVNGMTTLSLMIEKEDGHVFIQAIMAESGERDMQLWQDQQDQISTLLQDPAINSYHLQVLSPLLVKTAFLAQETPAYGLKTCWVCKSTESIPHVPQLGAKEGTIYSIENEYLSVQVSPINGTFTLTDKASGAQFTGLNRFVDGGDRGDEYNFSPPALDQLVQNTQVQAIRVTNEPLWQSIQVRLSLQVPCGVTPDRQSRSTELVELPILTEARLTKGVPRLDFHTQVDNHALDHRLRVHFPLPFVPKSARCDGHFQIVERSVDLPIYDETWTEQPRPEMPQRAFMVAAAPTIQFLLANRGLPEVELLHNSSGAEMALTLLRCVGWLSRGDLPERNGPAGPLLPTPLAQVPGPHQFDYAVILSKPDDPQAVQQAYAFNAPLRAVQTGLHWGRLPKQVSFLEIVPSTFLISAIKMTEDGSGWLVRGYNSTDKNIPVFLKPCQPVQMAWRVNLAESGEESLDLAADGSIRFSAHPFEIVTIKFSP
jgi:mannosylglycerate hydrolase